jgi:hypothetical protein
MGARVKVLSATLPLAAVVAITTGVSHAGRPATPPVHGYAVGEFGTVVRGLVDVVQRQGERGAVANVALHGLEPNTRYSLVGSRRPCGFTPSGFVTFRGTIRSDDDGEAFVRVGVALRRSLRTVRSLALVESGASSAAACAITGTYDSGTGILTFAPPGGSRAAPVHALVVSGVQRQAEDDALSFAVVRRPGQRRAEVYVSATGLEPNTTYRVVGSTRPCGQRVTTASRTFTASFRTDSDGDLALASRSARVTGALARTRDAVFIGGGAQPGAVCAVVSGTYDSGTGILT